jgi:predicted acylesterase/phospholipase RssA
MSGGANYGAWEAGIIWGLTHYGNPADFTWDVITGVSAGAINTAATSVWNVGDEVKMSEFISDTWTTLTTSNIWVNWPEGPATALFNKQGLVDDSPALEFITQTLKPFGKLSDRKFTVSAANVDTGNLEIFNQDNTTFEELPHAALSSGSIPTVFPN